MSCSHVYELRQRPQLLQDSEPAIEWKSYPRITPGVYHAYCALAKLHFDRAIRRHVCFLRWDVLSDDLLNLIARVPLWWNLGSAEKPRAGRRSKYFTEWIRANGCPPLRNDRLSPRVFRHRMAKVEVGDTDRKRSAAPYSVVRRIIAWETAPHVVTQSTTSMSQHWQAPSSGGRIGCSE